MKGCLIAIGVVIALALIVFGGATCVAHRHVMSQTGKPLALPEIPEAEKVSTELDRKLTQTSGPVVAAASPAPEAPGERTLTLGADELTILLRKMLPPEMATGIHVAIDGERVQLRTAIKGPDFARMIGADLGTIRWYVENKIAWVNLDLVCTMKVDNGQLQVQVAEVRQPSGLSAGHAQAVVDQAKGRGLPVITAGSEKLQVTGLTIQGGQAHVKVKRGS
jgi:hypothetical protein